MRLRTAEPPHERSADKRSADWKLCACLAECAHAYLFSGARTFLSAAASERPCGTGFLPTARETLRCGQECLISRAFHAHPEGIFDNSPTFQRWVGELRNAQVPKGRLKPRKSRGPSVVTSGLNV